MQIQTYTDARCYSLAFTGKSNFVVYKDSSPAFETHEGHGIVSSVSLGSFSLLQSVYTLSLDPTQLSKSGFEMHLGVEPSQVRKRSLVTWTLLL